MAGKGFDAAADAAQARFGTATRRRSDGTGLLTIGVPRHLARWP
jgi:hypothetical protein